MLTPQFKLSQSQNQIKIIIRLPYVKISACEFSIQQHCFKFYLKPYFLSLSFEQSLQQSQHPSKAVYYHQKHLLEVTLDKKNKGEHFENLNLLSRLMNKTSKDRVRKNKLGGKRVLVEVVGEQGDIKQINGEQQVGGSGYEYGFCHNYHNVFDNLEEQRCELFSFNPEEVAISDRYELGRKITQSVYDQDAYLFDKYENEDQIQQILNSKQSSITIAKMMQLTTSTQPQNYTSFKNSLKIPNKQLLVKPAYQLNIAKQLLSLSFCYLYQLKCMDGQFSVQSAKTINNTSSILNCCIDYDPQNQTDILIDCSRRCITYSLYKNLRICNQVVHELAEYFTIEFLRGILSSLRTMFEKSQPRYLLNTIFIDDYLIYCLKGKALSQIASMRENIKNISITEQNLGFTIQEQQQPSPTNQKQKQNIQQFLFQQQKNKE